MTGRAGGASGREVSWGVPAQRAHALCVRRDRAEQPCRRAVRRRAAAEGSEWRERWTQEPDLAIALMEEFLADRGQTFEDLPSLADDQRQHLMVEATLYAALRLGERAFLDPAAEY